MAANNIILKNYISQRIRDNSRGLITPTVLRAVLNALVDNLDPPLVDSLVTTSMTTADDAQIALIKSLAGEVISTGSSIVSITHGDDANTSALAAATYASQAATSATDAGQSATAASQASLDASTALSGAQSAQTASATSATDAAGSAATAQSAASDAAVSAADAGNQATAASQSASAASTHATDAAQSANSAQTALTSAQTAESSASSYASQSATSASDAAGSASAAAASETNVQAMVNGTSSQVSSNTTAIAGINNNLSATYSLRVKAGTAGAQLELIASSDPSGTASLARVDATDIILDGTITAQKMNISSISVLSPTLGTFESAATGARMVLQDNAIKVFDASGNLRVQIGDLSA